ncbi:MAG: hypothetical protein J6X60_11140 [Ruminiclostridium sp.]|nr:hypothetical protein [Ruminiclostridium sp.]
MAKLERELYGDYDTIVKSVYDSVMNGSMTASLEDSSRFYGNGTRCDVMVFERYSMLGDNRVSLSVTFFEADGRIFVSAISSGGSKATFFKFNTIGEETFLDTVRKTINSYSLPV